MMSLEKEIEDVLPKENGEGAEIELSQDDDLLSQEFSEDREEAANFPEKRMTTTAPVEAGDAEETAPAKNYSHLVVFTAHKAGMDSSRLKRTKEDIHRIIYENSKNSKFFKHALTQDKKLDRRIATLKRKLDGFRRRRECERGKRHAPAVTHEGRGITRVRHSLESARRLDRIWCVVDMDMFFAAVEMRDNPSLRGKPFGVGGMGMISTANYEARKWGVRSAMPGFIAKKLCPSLLLVKPNFEKYKNVAKITREIFATYDPNFTTMSLDEASLDITDYVEREVSRGGEGTQNRGAIANRVVRELRRRVRVDTQGCTCSAGIAPNRMLAKIASDRNKPDGQCFIDFTAESCIEFLRETPLRKIPGIGKVTEKILSECFDISTCGDIWTKSNVADEIRFLFNADTSRWLLSASLGIASATRNDERGKIARKGISQERTFSRTKRKRQELLDCCRKIAVLLSKQMTRKREGDDAPLRARTLTLKLKTEAFRTITRSRTLDRYINQAEDIYNEAKTLLLASMPIAIRLMGIRMSNFRGAGEALLRGQRKIDTFVRTKGAQEAEPLQKRGGSFRTARTQPKKKMRSIKEMLRPDGATAATSWTCEACTFENANTTFLACLVCSTPRKRK